MIESAMIRRAIKQSVIHPAVEDAIKSKDVGPSMYTPTELTAGIAALMNAVRLQTAPPVNGLIPSDQAVTIEETLFVELNNAVQQPEHGGNAQTFTQHTAHGNPGACSFAETRYAALLHTLQTGVHNNKWGPALVFRDKEGMPMLFQKFFDADNALGLTKITIDGVTYPAGTLYSVYSAVGKQLHNRYINGRWPYTKLRAHNVAASRINSIAPLRLSLFAIPPDEHDRVPDYDDLLSVSHPDVGAISLSRVATVDDFTEALS